MLELTLFFERALQTFLAVGPFLLVGLLAAAALDVLVGPRLLSGFLSPAAPSSRWTAALRGMLVGFLLPTCAVGAVPLAVMLRRSGVTGPGAVALVLTAAVSNPLAALTLLGLIEPLRALLLLGGAMAAAYVASVVFSPVSISEPCRSSAPATPGGSLLVRLLAVAGALARGPTLWALGLTVLSAATLAMLLPSDHIAHLVSMDEGGDPAAFAAEGVPWMRLLALVPIAFFAYVPPDLAATQAASAAHLRAVPSAGTEWLMLGAGVGPSTLLALGVLMPPKRVAATLTVLAVTAFTLAAAGHPLLQDRPPVPEDTHAFDRHARPYRVGLPGRNPLDDLPAMVWGSVSLPSLAACLGLGGLLLLDQRRRRSASAADPPPGDAVAARAVHAQVRPPTPLERATPARRRLLGGVLAAVLVLTGVYVVFPHPGLTIEQMRDPDALLAIAIRQDRPRDAVPQLLQLQRLSGRLGPGGAIRPWARPAGHAELCRRVGEAQQRLAEALGQAEPPPREHLEGLAIAHSFALRDLYAAWSR
ncbi:MAG: hypothetical protein ACK4PI_10000 [Tepidisphaerales bacterium]